MINLILETAGNFFIIVGIRIFGYGFERPINYGSIRSGTVTFLYVYNSVGDP
jgi:hypothetical protein